MIKTPMLIEGKEVELETSDCSPKEKTETAEEPLVQEPGAGLDDIARIMYQNVIGFAGYVQAKHTVFSEFAVVPFVDYLKASFLEPYAPYLRFGIDLTDGGFIYTKVRELSRSEYLSALKKTSPVLGDLLEKTDLKEYLPEEFNPRDSLFFGFLSSLDFSREPGRQALLALTALSRKCFNLASLEAVSLFMTEGDRFRKYLKSLPRQDKEQFAFFNTVRAAQNKDWDFPVPFSLFSPEKLLNYVEENGDPKVRAMVSEYERIWDVFQKSRKNEDLFPFLSGRLKMANPRLLLEE